MHTRPSARTTLLLLAVSAYLAVQLPKLLILGTNADGTEYAAVARNMAEGYGSLFRPYLSDYQFPLHYEQPPLMYGIQAVLFRIFGDGDYFEGIYGIVVGGLVVALVGLLWRRVRRDRGLPEVGAWWPILLLLSVIPFLYTCQTNRMIATFLVFFLLSVYLACRSVASHGSVWLFGVLAGLALFLAFQTKGPFALLVLAVPIAAVPTLKVPLSRAVLATVVIGGTFAQVFGLMLLLFEDSLAMWVDLLEKQVFASVAGEREAGESRLFGLWMLVEKSAGPLGLVLIAGLVARARFRELRPSRPAALFLVVGVAGCLPILLLERQKFRYMLHAYVLLVLGLAFVTERIATRIEEAVARRPRLRTGLLAGAALLVLGGASAMIALEGRVMKAHAFYEDVYLQDLGIPERATVTVLPRRLIWKENLFQYMQRHLKVSITENPGNEYLLVQKDVGIEVPEGYRQINRDPQRYVVYRFEGRER